MQIVVSDTSCLIDLDKANVLLAALGLPFRFVVPDLLFQREVKELENTPPEDLPDHGLEVIEVSGEVVAQAQAYTAEDRRLSFYDCLALAYTETQEEAVLFTADGPLRAFATSKGIEVHGVLWAIEQLVVHGQLQKSEAIEILEMFRDDPLVRLGNAIISRAVRRIEEL